MQKEIKTAIHTFKSPLSQVTGDVFIFIIVVLFYTIGLTLSFGFFYLLIFETAKISLILKICLIPSLIISGIARIRGLNWQIIMYQEELAIGIPGLKKRICYNQVFFISHGTIPERLYKEERNKNKPVTSISIEYKKTGKSKILLHTEQAVECFQYLIRHCPNAAAVDMDSKEFLPKKSSQKERAIKTLRRRKIINGYAAIAIGASCILLACFGVNEYKDAIQYTRTEALRIIALIAGAVWIAFGTKILRG